MTHWPIQRNVFTLLPSNKSNETAHVLTTHNTNTPARISLSTVSTYDDSLTNLSWLHDINIFKQTIPTINHSKRKESSPAIYPNDIEDNEELMNNDDEQWKMYKTNPQAKPVYSYSQLILLAMRQSGYEKMTLQMIYEWVAENFPYFKKMEPTWQNSIRHNLSLNKYFIKVPRTKKEVGGGKGGFWKLSAHYQRQYLQKNEKRNRSSNNIIKSETWIDPILLPCPTSYIRMPSSFLSPISSPDSLTVPSFGHQQQMNDLSIPSPSNSPCSMSTKQNFISTKLDETEMLLLDAVTFDWDAYLNETPNDIDVQPLLSNKTEQDLFNDFNAALTDLTYSAVCADPNAFDGFDYPTKHSTFQSLFDDEEQQPAQSLAVKGRGIKRPAWWLNNESISPTKLPSLETAFDLKFSK